MKKIESLLTLVDFSSLTNNVLEAAILFTRKFSAKLIVYHSAPNIHSEEQINELKRHFHLKIASLVDEPLDVQVMIASEVFPNGQLLNQLLSDVDLLVIGGGKTGSKDAKRKKIVKIVDQCEQPLLVIPQDWKIEQIEQILYCSSYGEFLSNAPLDTIKYMATFFNAEIRLAHVKTHGKKPNDKHVERSKREGAFFEPEVKFSFKLIRNNDVIDGINQYIKKKGDNDMLVMVRRKHHMLDRIFGENFTFRMLQRTPIPLLILKDSQLN